MSLLIAAIVHRHFDNLTFDAYGPDELGRWAGVVCDENKRQLIHTGPDFNSRYEAREGAAKLAQKIRDEIEQYHNPTDGIDPEKGCGTP